jgi:hypothetical protein
MKRRNGMLISVASEKNENKIYFLSAKKKFIVKEKGL